MAFYLHRLIYYGNNDDMKHNDSLNKKLKWQRASDLVTLAIWAPVLIPTTFSVLVLSYINFGIPPFYRQKRVGYMGREFNIVKARTMQDIDIIDPTGVLKAIYNNFDEAEKAVFDDEFRINKIARFMRKSRLDELPQIWNIAKGDMSFVGPRPHKIEDTINTKYQKRQMVRAGLTGMGKIKGFNNMTHDEEGDEDKKYVNSVLESNVMQLQAQRIRICFKTVASLMKYRKSCNAYMHDKMLDPYKPQYQ